MYRLFLVPTLVFNVAVIVAPAIMTLVVAFCRWDGITAPQFVGFDNFVDLTRDYVFWGALLNNIIWALIFLTVPIGLGLLVAALLLLIQRGAMIFQLIFFLPVIIATVVTARVWQIMIYSPVTGLLGMLQRLGLPVRDPLSQPSLSLFGVVTVDLWHWWGFLCVVFYAALRQVPTEQIEAAQIEGANFWQMLRHVLIPAIRPTITLMAILTIIWSFLGFDLVYILTGGGPAYSSELLATLAYRQAFTNLDVGHAAALALIISLFGITASILYVRVQAQETDS